MQEVAQVEFDLPVGGCLSYVQQPSPAIEFVAVYYFQVLE